MFCGSHGEWQSVCVSYRNVCVCVQWVVTEQSCSCYSRVVVPLYDTLGPDAVTYIINLGASVRGEGLQRTVRLFSLCSVRVCGGVSGL